MLSKLSFQPYITKSRIGKIGNIYIKFVRFFVISVLGLNFEFQNFSVKGKAALFINILMEKAFNFSISGSERN